MLPRLLVEVLSSLSSLASFSTAFDFRVDASTRVLSEAIDERRGFVAGDDEVYCCDIVVLIRLRVSIMVA